MNKGNESCKLVLEHRRGKKRLLTGSGKMLLKQCCSNGTLKGHWYHPIDILGRISLQNKIGRKTKHRKNTLSTHRVPVRRIGDESQVIKGIGGQAQNIMPSNHVTTAVL